VPVTIGDVARLAGVSTATVSRVLSGVGGARPATSERVVAAARDLGYRPSGIARSLKLRTTRTLGLIVTDIENPFFPQLVRAVEDAAQADGYALLLCNAADDPEREAAYLDLLVDRRVDGVIIAASSLGARHGEWLAAPPLPVVLVNAPGSEVALPSVTSDNRSGGRIAAEHLLALGHRRIGVLTAGPRNPDASLRLAGISDALLGAGLDPLGLATAAGEATVTGGERAMALLLDRAPQLTGILAYNDLMAIGALRALRAAGRRIPEDVSVVGFDDVQLAAYLEPPLTTIAQATADMGRWAVERLRDLLAARLAALRPDRGGQPAGTTTPSGAAAASRAAAASEAAETTTASEASGAPAQEPAPGREPVVFLPVRLVVRGSTGPAPAAES
jgi:DNA-binding LacI/PurR family transcriptional regulator